MPNLWYFLTFTISFHKFKFFIEPPHNIYSNNPSKELINKVVFEQTQWTVVLEAFKVMISFKTAYLGQCIYISFCYQVRFHALVWYISFSISWWIFLLVLPFGFMNGGTCQKQGPSCRAAAVWTLRCQWESVQVRWQTGNTHVRVSQWMQDGGSGLLASASVTEACSLGARSTFSSALPRPCPELSFWNFHPFSCHFLNTHCVSDSALNAVEMMKGKWTGASRSKLLLKLAVLYSSLACDALDWGPLLPGCMGLGFWISTQMLCVVEVNCHLRRSV